MGNKLKLMIVDNSPTLTMKLRTFLEKKGHGVIWAENDKKGLITAKEIQPDIIICDASMPETDGHEVCRHIKEDQATRHIPVLLLISLAVPENLVRGLKSGADYFVAKPYHVEYLLSRIEEITAQKTINTNTAEPPEMEFVFHGKKHMLNSSRLRIMNLLLAIYENTVQQNGELTHATEELQKVNQQLKDKLHELKISEDRFHSFVMTTPDIVYRIDPEGKFTFVNNAVGRLGYTAEDLVGQHFSEIVLPADVSRISRDSVLNKYAGKTTGDEKAPKFFDERRAGNRKTTGLEVRILPKHGRHAEPASIETLGDTLITVDINSSGMYGVQPGTDEKIFVGTVGVIRDISARKKIEQALEESKLYSRTILDNTDTGILVIDKKDHVVVDANPAALRIMSFSRDALVGSVCHQFICPAKNGKCPAEERNLNGEKSESLLLASDGTRIPILKTVATIRLNGREHFLESFMDITELKKVQTELNKTMNNLEQKVKERTADLIKSQSDLVQAEKLAAVGILTAGIAHELNNPLMGMLNYIEYCLKHTGKNSKTYPVIEDTKHETERCVKIVKNLLTFSRVENADQEAYQKMSCRTLLERVFRLLSYRIEKGNVIVRKEYSEDIPRIWIKPTNIQQVLLNLIGNALDAVDNQQTKELMVRMGVEEGSFCISISDNGPGISPENASKVFDPFFTTKPVGKGTGLGLSISRGIVQDHGGDLVCSSKVGEGATFKVILPLQRNELP